VETKTLSKDLARREFFRIAGVGVAGFGLKNTSFARGLLRRSGELLVYVGTYTAGKSEGIYLYRMSLASGELKRVANTRGVVNPSFLTLAPSRRYLYAVNEVDEFAGKKSGAVSSFLVDQRTGELRFLNQQPSLGGAPCYVTVDATGRFVLVANYGGGNVVVFPAHGNGSLGQATDMKQDRGSSANHERQEGPHAHCIVLDPSNKFAYSCDLGTDKIMIYRFDARDGKLLPARQPWAQVKPGTGPRHLAFHDRDGLLFVLNELNSTVATFVRDPKQGSLKEVHSVSTLPADFKDTNWSADIHVSPDGRFVYCSNRGHNSIAVFAVDSRRRGLRMIGHQPTLGSWPRNFAIDPSGAFLLVANQKSDNIVAFRIDYVTGRLTHTHTVEAPSPVCLKFTDPFS
jgi:6-phosphogluconolactonase